MLRVFPLLALALAVALVHRDTRADEVAAPVAKLAFREAGGKAVAWKEVAGAKATVVAFLSFDCPMSTGYAKPLADLAAAYSEKGVRFVALCPTDDEPAALAKRAEEYKLGFPVFQDAKLAAADALGATVTPEMFVLDAGNVVRYRGPIDDGFTKRLVPNRRASEAYLKNALEAVVAGKPVAVAKAEPVGCKIVRAAPKAAAGGPAFYKDVLPILQEHCQECHRPGEVGPFALTTYKQAAAWAEDVKAFTHDRRMPPWKPVAGKEFVGDRRLAEKDVATLAAWVDAGCPEGDPKDAPPPRQFTDGWALGKPDLVLEPDEDFVLGPTGPDYFRVFVLPTGFTEDRYVSAVEVRPGNPRVVHHSVNFYDGTGTARTNQAFAQAEEKKARKPGDVDVGGGFSAGMGLGISPKPTDLIGARPVFGPLGGWAPGLLIRELPDGSGFLLPKGADVVMQLHYHRSGRVEKDRTRVGLYFSKKPVERAVLPIVVPGYFKTDKTSDDPRRSGLGYIPAGDPKFVSRGTWYVLEDTTLIAMLPHMHLLGKSVKVTMTPPGGKPEVLIEIADWDFNWQENYVFKEPVKARRGTRFDVEAVFDNSAANPNNPRNPPVDVLFGEQTTDEMLFAIFAGTKDRPKSGMPYAIAQGPLRLGVGKPR